MRISDWSSDVCSSDLPEPERLPAVLDDDADAVFTFCRAIVDTTAPYVCAFKPQIAHFAAPGADSEMSSRNFLSSRASRATLARINERSRSEGHTSELQSLMRISIAGFCLQKKTTRPQKESSRIA